MDYSSILKSRLQQAGASPAKKETILTEPKKQKARKKKVLDTADYGDVDNGDYEDFGSLQEKEQKEKIRKLQIDNESKLRNLVEKDLVVAIIGEIGQSLKNNFIDQSKRKAYIWANQLGITSRERDIEKLIGDMVKEGIQGVKSDIDRLCNDKTFE